MNITLCLKLHLQNLFSTFFEYPPDPNRGFDVSPASILVEDLSCKINSSDSKTTTKTDTQSSTAKAIAMSRSLYQASEISYKGQPSTHCHKWVLYTNGLAILAPLPDFSMPYNVITLTCTVIAFFFGQAVKILVRRYGEVLKGKKFVSQRPLAKVLEAVVYFFENGFKRQREQPSDGATTATNFDLFDNSD